MLRRALLARAAGAMLAACGIKGPLKLAPPVPPQGTPAPEAVPAPNAPTPGQEPPAPVEPRSPVQ